MKLLVPAKIADDIREALLRVGLREIGGVLMGEHVGLDTFRVSHITIQKRGGTFATFVRIVNDILGPLQRFFSATKHEYKRFNYMGEWHSHHSFALRPSEADHVTMEEIANDSELGARFVLLFLVKLDSTGRVDGTVTVYRPSLQPFLGSVIWEEAA
jgi:hypothetical protein